MDARLALDMTAARLRLYIRERWPRQRVQAYQQRRLQALREFARARSPFYRKFHHGLERAPLAELPVLTKAVMMENFDDLVTDRALRLSEIERHAACAPPGLPLDGKYWICRTSGTTGTPGTFVFDRSEWAAALASGSRGLGWARGNPSLFPRTRYAAVLSGASWHYSAQARGSIPTWLMPMLWLAADDPLPAIVEALNRWQPHVLQTFPSVAHVLAAEQAAGRLHIGPRVVTTSSEVLTPEARRLIQSAWGKPPFDTYGCTEAGIVASECQRHSGLHLYEDRVAVEVVDERNNPVPPGELGAKVLVTVLFTRTQPLIRYEIGDMIRLARDPCPCRRGYPLIEEIQGRIEDVLRFPARDGGEVSIQPAVFEDIVESVPSTGWQVIQDGSGLTVLISGMTGGSGTIRQGIEQALRSRGAVVPAIRIDQVPAIPRSASGKAPLIKCNLPRSDRGSASNA
jgi:putative adenylate-forming enzyme